MALIAAASALAVLGEGGDPLGVPLGVVVVPGVAILWFYYYWNHWLLTVDY